MVVMMVALNSVRHHEALSGVLPDLYGTITARFTTDGASDAVASSS